MDTQSKQIENQKRCDLFSRVEVYSDLESLNRIEPVWRKLSKEAGGHFGFFQSPAWALNWLKENPDTEITMVTAWRGNELVMALPMMVRNSFGVSILEVMSGPDAEYQAPIFAENIDQKALFAAVLNDLSSNHKFDILRLNSTPVDAEICELANPEHRLQSELEYSSIIELTDFDSLDSYLASRSKNSRKSFRRKMQAFEKLGDVKSITHPVTEDYKTKVFPQICQWKRDWFDANGILGGNFNRSDMEEQLAALCQTSDKSQPALATELILDGKLVACDIMLQENGILYSYVTARDLSYDKYGLGTVLDMHTIRYAIENNFSAIDLLAGPNPSKESLSTKKVPIVDLRFPLTTKGNWQVSIDRLRARDHIKTGFYKLPIGIRQSVLRLKSKNN